MALTAAMATAAAAMTTLLTLPIEREAQYGFQWDPEALEHGEAVRWPGREAAPAPNPKP